MLKTGISAPAFTLKDQEGKHHTLSDYQGQWVLIYFYPKDDTPGCTKEACAFRDNNDKLQEVGIKVFGISKDDVKSHQKFAQKYHLNFPLLADPEGAVCQQYEALGEKNIFGKTFMGVHRISYLINPEGKIVKTYPKVKPEEHATQIIADVSSMK